jgi:hypothetical protein
MVSESWYKKKRNEEKNCFTKGTEIQLPIKNKPMKGARKTQ